MRSPENILAAKKPEVLRNYLARMTDFTVPQGVQIPQDPQEALLLGMRISRRRSYEDGLVDGVNLGIDVFFEAASQ